MATNKQLIELQGQVNALAMQKAQMIIALQYVKSCPEAMTKTGPKKFINDVLEYAESGDRKAFEKTIIK